MPRLRRAAPLVLAALLASPGSATASPTAAARTSPQDPPAPAPTLLSVREIWSGAPHCAFTDLARWRGRWWCVFREGERHVHGRDGGVRVLVSDDGESFSSAALLQEEGVDLRDPKLSVTPDGRLMVLMGGSVYRERALVDRRPRVSFSADGESFSDPAPVLESGDWLWRVTWHEGVAYGASYRSAADPWSLVLHRSEDGVAWRPVAALDVPGRPNETTLRFLPDGRMIALIRREGEDRAGWIGSSAPPYTDWSFRPAGPRLGGPNFVIADDGSMWAATRTYGDAMRTALFRMSVDGLAPALELPSEGDTSYPGMVLDGEVLWLSYYSSHAPPEGGASSAGTRIFLARVRLPPSAPR